MRIIGVKGSEDVFGEDGQTMAKGALLLEGPVVEQPQTVADKTWEPHEGETQ